MYHQGEIEAQRRADVRDLAERVGGIIGGSIPPRAAAFLAARSFVIVATRGVDGAVRASMLTGPPGFANVTGERSLELRPGAGHVETVLADVEATGVLGLLAIDFPHRRRLRVNGRATVNDGVIVVTTAEVYSNCPQYITQRDDGVPSRFASAKEGAVLTQVHRELIARADTFFIASVHLERGADASHRGGPPGFVTAEPTRVSWPDYSGNNMFNTIGNLLIEPRCGLLFVDFKTGVSLQIEGRASVNWEGERAVTVEVERVIG
jgi:predicted pyridoxine 5'-phosphate oxidase superfamily flavin-nucleotide-binding protein